jgi:hypothetical protein
MDKVIAALSVHVTVPAYGNNGHLPVGHLHAGRVRNGTPVKPVEKVAFHEVRQLGGLPYSREENDLLRREVQARKGLLHILHYLEITSPRTPLDIDTFQVVDPVIHDHSSCRSFSRSLSVTVSTEI